MVRRLVLVLLAVSVCRGAMAAPPEVVELTVLHTSDLHGQVLPFDDAAGRAARGSLARVSAAVESIRAEVDHPVLLLDSGDTIQGSPLEEFVHIRRGQPSPTIEAMNRMGYLAMAVGNHEFNFGLEPLRRAEDQAEFPFLAANAVRRRDGKPAFQPYRVLRYADLTVGILGLVTPNIPGWEEPDHYEGLRFEPMDDAARRWVPLLRNREHCDLVIVLAHTGFEIDPETGHSDGSEYENFADRLTRVPGIDLLLTGHTHRNIPPTEVNGVIVSQPSSRGLVVTRIDLEMVRAETGEWRIARWKGENLDLDATPIDQRLVSAFDERRREVTRFLEGPLTTVTKTVGVRGCRLHDCAALDLIHRVQLEASGADLSLAGLLTDRTPDLEPGVVTRRWVRSLYIYSNTLLTVRLTGAQVRDVLEHSARYYDGLECPGTGPCILLADPNIRHYNIDTIEGLSYRIDPTRPEGERIRDLRRSGLPLDLHAELTLVCNNYRAAGGGGYPHLANAEVVWRSSKEVSAMIDDFLEGLDEWDPSADGNWLIAPEVTREEATGSDEFRSKEAQGGS